jgi:carboxyl-terminal processing protease
MKKQVLTYLTIFILFFIFVSYTYFDNEQKDKVLLEAVSQTLRTGHYLSMNIDDKFSEKMYDLYLKRLDYSKRFLIQSDIDQLNSYQHLIDDEVNKGTYTFFDLSVNLIHKRIEEARGFYKEILASPFDFKKDETIELEPDKCKFPKNDEELRESWRKFLKFQVLSKLDEMIELQEKAIEKKDTVLKIKSFDELEADARDKILKSQDDWFKRMDQVEELDRRTMFLNCITNIYDPHTGYFPPKDKEDFDIQMSGKLEGIGATLQSQSDGYIKVTNIVIGSAAWKEGELEVGDLILKVAQADKEPVDVVDMRIDNAVQLIRGPKGTEVRLTVKKRDGNLKIIPIIRDVVVLEETFAKSLIIKEKDEKNKVGYIYLPKFYMDFNDNNGRNCTKDMETEIEKLKKENINGLIVDLRDNGGGSLQDVVRIAGLFIEKGPIVQVKSRAGAPYIMDDKDPKIQYKDPLVILVNSFSASASEILAAAIQDYHRGIIIGSNSTFGKGSVQRFIDFDEYLPAGLNSFKPLGSLKITIQKFYRINGGTTQLQGVIPDIILPDSYSYLKVGEREQDNPMPVDQIDPANYDKWYVNYDFDKIKKKSNDRIKKDPTFRLIDENAQRLKKQQDITNFSLNLEKFKKTKKQNETEAKKYENIGKNETGMEPTTLQEDFAFVNQDTVKLASRNKWIKEVKKDVYVYEAFRVLKEINN